MLVRGSWISVLCATAVSRVVLVAPFSASWLAFAFAANDADKQEDDHAAPDRDASEIRLFSRCRRDPTWRSVDYDACQALLDWKPRDRWWRHDPTGNALMLKGKDKNITDCLDKAFENAKIEHSWAAIR